MTAPAEMVGAVVKGNVASRLNLEMLVIDLARAPLPSNVIEVAEGFWNIRGSFKIAGLYDLGTHASLVRRASGKLVLLDAC